MGERIESCKIKTVEAELFQFVNRGTTEEVLFFSFVPLINFVGYISFLVPRNSVVVVDGKSLLT